MLLRSKTPASRRRCAGLRAGLGGIALAFALLSPAGSGSAWAATCHDPGGFPAFLAQIKREAIAQGISANAVEEGLDGVTLDPGVIRRDHGQGVFRQSFEQFSQRMVPPRLARARSLQQRHADLFARIEQQYGVSSPILLAIWGLETDFGSSHGNFRMIQSLATLAYDCRRSAMFQAELLDALRMVQRGVSPNARSAWAGEIGQTQFMPSTYIKYAVGGRDLDHSVSDVLSSTANFLRAHGWQRGAGWAPGQPNFAAIQEWNKSSVYSRTIAYFATRLAGGSDAAYRGDDDDQPRRTTRSRPDDDQADDAPPPRRRRAPAIDPLDEQ